jgi:ribosomal protein L11 methyltransferase
MCPDDLKNTIYSFFENRQMRITPSDLERQLRQTHLDFSPKALRSAIKAMVTDGTLLYTNHFNTTHLELNFCRPVLVSRRIILSPHGHTCQPADDETQIIKMHQGSAFGIGDHPTTRLALRAMDNLMDDAMVADLQGKIRALDIGTGSGVLAMAAVRLGAERVVAMDIDHLALHEARNNIRLNDMDQAILLTSDSLENLAGTTFDLVVANLRPPTFKQILPQIAALSSNNCHWIISGFRKEALEEVARILYQEKTEIQCREVACGWAALTVRYTR